ncbi:VOC family protein [Neobacillus kokaensis]|uniref:Lactoylglutathione lyase n=1 Tax=Neobacillus kokaensis TaxID=2759023 RepID=A0ABQ3N4K1_9BACI|nr:VOC family protein [Neobacillus kokaensis]GHH98923.1 lactoylglutathione lyase [Neobacillus kokaensis]
MAEGRVVGFIHSGITVKNLESALDFYVNILGFELLSTQVANSDYIFDIVEIPGLKEIKIAFVQIPGGHVLELLEYVGIDTYSASSRSCDYGTGHICLMVENLEEMFKELKAKGVQFKSKKVANISAGANKGSKAVYMLDPDGYIIELMEKKLS